MVRLYMCHACKEGRHEDCEIGHPAPKGVFGGSSCICCCGGNKREPLEPLPCSNATWEELSESVEVPE